VKAINKFLLFTTVVCLLTGFISCQRITHTHCPDRNTYCPPCQRVVQHLEYCYCQPDTAFHCTANMVHASYNYSTCGCRCDYGWTGANCDQLDTSIYISFRHGSDTLALSSAITPLYRLQIEYWGKELTALFPAGGAIDSVKFGNFPGEVGTVPFCGGRCPYMEVYFSNGQQAFSVSGNLNTDTLGTIGFMRNGTFNADLYTVGTGDIYYVRNGVFNMAW
jgi:hypothetical protein